MRAVRGRRCCVGWAQGQASTCNQTGAGGESLGPFANTGEAVFRNLLWATERVNARGGVRLADGLHELVIERYDSKGQNEEALSALRAAIDNGARIIMQGNSSATAAALLDAIDKHNSRNPHGACCISTIRPWIRR